MTTPMRSRHFVRTSTDLNSIQRALPTCGRRVPGSLTLCAGTTLITVTAAFDMCHRRSAMPVRMTRFLPRVIRCTPRSENSIRHVSQATPETGSCRSCDAQPGTRLSARTAFGPARYTAVGCMNETTTSLTQGASVPWP